MSLRFPLALCFLLLAFTTAKADPSNCFGLNEGCVARSHPYVGGSSPGEVKINPSAVPIEESLGLEALVYKSDVDFLLVRGNGRVGAALSPANSESTFFGPPALETQDAFLQRHLDGRKYPSDKFTLAAAFGLYDNRASDLKHFAVRLGAMGKYNTKTGSILPGGGLTVVLGPLNLTSSYYKDETKWDDQTLNGPTPPSSEVDHYHVQTYGAGLYLSSLILDYSHLQLREDELTSQGHSSDVDLFTAGLVLRKAILTLSYRRETSAMPAYDDRSRSLVAKEVKTEYFGGAQYKLGRHLMVGALYNYYLLHEFTAAVTLLW